MAIKLQHPTKGPIIYVLKIFPGAGEGLICGPGELSNQHRTDRAYLMSGETCRAAKLSSGRFWLWSSFQPRSALSHLPSLCGLWWVAPPSQQAASRRQGVKVQENNNHQKSRAILESGQPGGCCRFFRTNFVPLMSICCSLAVFFSSDKTEIWGKMRNILEFRVPVPLKLYCMNLPKEQIHESFKMPLRRMKSHFLCNVRNARWFNHVLR